MWSATGPPPGAVTLMLVGLSVPVGVQWRYKAEPARTRRPVEAGRGGKGSMGLKASVGTQATEDVVRFQVSIP